MKATLLKQRKRARCLYIGFLIFAVNIFLASASLVRAADTRIAFMSTRNSDNGEIFLMNPDGKRVRQLTRHLQYDSSPAWSPDGQKIAFMSYRDEHRFKGWGSINGEIYVMNADGTNPINLTQSPERADGSPSWSPDGKQIVFHVFEQGIADIWVMGSDGGKPRNLTNHDALDGYPDWSPDGKQITFSSDRDGGRKFEAWENREVYVMNADGTNLINLTNHPADDRHPDWSPDGLRIAFSSNRDGDWEKKPNDNWEVYVMNADGPNPINLTNHKAWDSGPVWEPVPNLSVSSNGKLATVWGKVKRSNTYGRK